MGASRCNAHFWGLGTRSVCVTSVDDVVRQFLSREVLEMRVFTKTALGVLLVLFGAATAGVTAAVADEDVKMVFHVEGMR